MNTVSLKIGSYTLGMKSCEILNRNNISCNMSKISDSTGKYGCIYAIWVNKELQWRAESLLRSSGIMILP